MRFQGRERTIGLIRKHTEASGSKIKCMDREFYSGPMGNSTMDNSKMISGKELENSHGKMVVFTTVNGKKGNKTVKEFSLTNWGKPDKEFGKTGKILSG
jgi:phosphosulfolactate phosphohydrolase-like enzyme